MLLKRLRKNWWFLLHRAKILGFIMTSLTILACTSPETQPTKGKVVQGELSTKKLSNDVAYQVYLPPNYDSLTTKLPILYLLHGHGGDHQDWFQEEEGDVARLLDSLIQNEIIPPLIATTIDAGNSWYVNRDEIQMEDFYLSEFMPFLETAYRIDTNQRIIAGNSAGGYGALRFSLRQPQTFQQVILLSPASYEPLPPAISSSRKVKAFAKDSIFSDSIWSDYSYTHRWQNAQRNDDPPFYFLSVGDDDVFNIVPVVTRLQQQMLQDSIPNELRISDGGHDWKCWKHHTVAALTQIFNTP
ncbi:alpha/beta hydrolase [Altibacter sp. HG106]|uniref:alpha/beta hydrolase n=1 Tax=Altibacter sp. HG106 TaxID=3023937 RepID=UPI002350271C|nr:alpha/beta hydrolase-fold protein [Altibacter sp. HG106]MDC7993931.1 alpha/beta hydrolase-fold protein [Altibacter sp. HG106]